MPYCPECGGEMKYANKNYICTSCGLTVNQQEIVEAKDKKMFDDDEDPRAARRKEYLKWWLSKK